MDKRLTALFLVVYAVFGAIALGTLEFDGFAIWNLYVTPSAFSIVNFAVPLVALFGWILIVLAITDALSKRYVIDGRYFTRCFFYRIASVVFTILYCVIPSKEALDFPLIYPHQNAPGINEKLQLYGFLAGCVAALILSATVTAYVILGITSNREKIIESNNRAVAHTFMQFVWGLDLISTLYLMIREFKCCPNEKILWLKRAAARRPLPIPDLLGVVMGVAALWGINILDTLITYGRYNASLGSQNMHFVPTSNTTKLLNVLFFFLLPFLIWSILDARHYFRELPTALTSSQLLQKTMFYTCMSLALEAVLISLLSTIAAGLTVNPSFIPILRKYSATKGYGVYITLLAAAILLVHLSTMLYTRLVVKRSAEDRLIPVGEAVRCMRMTWIPGGQIVVLLRIMKANREPKETE